MSGGFTLKGLIGIGVLFASPTAFSFMIGNLTPDLFPPQSCRLELKSAPFKNELNISMVNTVTCSATLIGKSTLISAAHCFYGREFQEALVHCPGETPKSVTNWTIPKTYTDDTFHLDMAIIRIDETVQATPVNIPEGPEDLMRLFERTAANDPPDCRVFGYGEDEGLRSGFHGGRKVTFEKWVTGTRTFFTVDPITKKETITKREDILDWWKEKELVIPFRAEGNLKDSTKPTNAIRHGDSGGGLICKDPNGEDVLIGLSNGYSQLSDPTHTRVNTGSALSVGHNIILLAQLLKREKDSTITGQPTNPSPLLTLRSTSAGRRSTHR